jgi:hypothetical protein
LFIMGNETDAGMLHRMKGSAEPSVQDVETKKSGDDHIYPDYRSTSRLDV